MKYPTPEQKYLACWCNAILIPHSKITADGLAHPITCQKCFRRFEVVLRQVPDKFLTKENSE